MNFREFYSYDQMNSFFVHQKTAPFEFGFVGGGGESECLDTAPPQVVPHFKMFIK